MVRALTSQGWTLAELNFVGKIVEREDGMVDPGGRMFWTPGKGGCTVMPLKAWRSGR
jgi:hypothetical protein